MVSGCLKMAVASELFNMVIDPKIRICLSGVILNANDVQMLESALARTNAMTVILSECGLKNVEATKMSEIISAYGERLVLDK